MIPHGKNRSYTDYSAEMYKHEVHKPEGGRGDNSTRDLHGGLPSPRGARGGVCNASPGLQLSERCRKHNSPEI